MDPICHTLVGATLAQAGLGRRSRLAAAAAVIGANLPDIDALAYVTGDSLLWRRGWTHGVPALVAWPFVLTGCLLAWDRLGRRRRPTESLDAEAWPLLVTAAVAVLTHPVLDYLNNYGLRWFMPLDGRWFYGDALFIVDPWIWIVLAAGTAGSWWLGRRESARRIRSRPARVALGLVTAYSLLMLGLGQAGRAVVRTQLAQRGIEVTRDPMVSPVFASLDRRYVVAEVGAHYHVAGFRWWPRPSLDEGVRLIARNADHPAVGAARGAPEARGFLRWARFPFFVVQPDAAGFTIVMDDARYAPASGESWAAVRVHVPASAMGSAIESDRARLPAPPHGIRRVAQVLLAVLRVVPCA